jgi:glycosyltransferase involved in cell wall biosynthesis
VDTDFFSPGEAAKPREFTVLFVGQLVRQKGLHYLLEAWQRLRLPNAELRIVAHGAVSSALGKDCAASSVSFVGSLCREDLRNEYRRADLLCLPSLSDGFGLVVLEAMACGTPALLTTGCGAADVVENGKNGFLVPSASLDDLMLRLEWAFENRSALREIGKAARATAQAFPWSRFRAELVATLRSLDS